MKTLSLFLVMGTIITSILGGCSNGPSPEQQTREQQEEQETAKRQAEFFKTSPPPASKPGQ